MCILIGWFTIKGAFILSASSVKPDLLRNSKKIVFFRTVY